MILEEVVKEAGDDAKGKAATLQATGYRVYDACTRKKLIEQYDRQDIYS